MNNDKEINYYTYKGKDGREYTSFEELSEADKAYWEGMETDTTNKDYANEADELKIERKLEDRQNEYRENRNSNIVNDDEIEIRSHRR